MGWGVVAYIVTPFRLPRCDLEGFYSHIAHPLLNSLCPYYSYKLSSEIPVGVRFSLPHSLISCYVQLAFF